MKSFIPVVLALALIPLSASAATECPYAIGENYLEQVGQ
jgi:hypothetical protein